MKKLLIAMVLGALLVLALATVALADNGPHGGWTTDNEDACASCHRIHTAQSADGFLLKDADIYTLCMSCHDGTGAATNVKDGTYVSGTEGSAGEGLFGGGFENVPMDPNRYATDSYTAGAYPAPAPVTSHHVVDGGAGTVWGAGDLNAPNNTSLTLECTSCHNPHGQAGMSDGTPNGNAVATYRILNYEPHGSNGFETTGISTTYFYVAGYSTLGTDGGYTVPDLATKWYTVNSNSAYDGTVATMRSRNGMAWWAFINNPGDYSGRTYVYMAPAFNVPAGTAIITTNTTQYSCSAVTAGTAYDTSCDTDGVAAGAWWNNTPAQGRLGQWCATCHDRYIGNRLVDSGDALYKYRHSATGSLSCVICHTAHGTAATMDTALVQNATLNTGSSTLLKLNNRGLCIDCHGYDWGLYGATKP